MRAAGLGTGAALGAALTAAFAIELYYTLEYPLFDRNKIVEVATTSA